MATRPVQPELLARRAPSLLAVTVALLALAACQTRGQSPNNTMTANPGQQFQELIKHPDIEQISRRYEEMATKVHDRLVAEVGLSPWKQDPDGGSRSGCRGYSDVTIPDAQSRGLPIWYSESNMSDDEWSQAARIATDISGAYGFDSPQTVVDGPGQHHISIKDQYGAELSFGSRVNTSILILTGCHLTPEAHKRGTPSGGP